MRDACIGEQPELVPRRGKEWRSALRAEYSGRMRIESHHDRSPADDTRVHDCTVNHRTVTEVQTVKDSRREHNRTGDAREFRN